MGVDYLQLMINSSFTGVGTAIGLAIWEIFLKDKVHHIASKIKGTTTIIKPVVTTT